MHLPTSPTTATAEFDILLIEDDETVRKLLTNALEHRGYSVHAAANGRTALRSKSTSRFRLVITDLFMPEMDGLEVIMEHNRTTPQIPLLAMTGGYHYSEPEETLRMARILGSDCTIQKPFELTDFLITVEKVLGSPVRDGSARRG
ncbi:MAG: response regulator [Opitutus sp.]